MNQNTKFRPTAIPLVANDPYLSIWSFTDKLTDDHTRHWTGVLQSMFGFITIDGEKYRFMGKTAVTDRYFPEGRALEQTDVTVNPTSIVYTFSHPACELRVTFLTPLLLDRPEVFSRPVSYIFYDITPREEGHTFSVYFDAASYLCGDGQCVKEIDCFAQDGHVWMGNHEQKPLNRSGDDVRIDWGYLHLVHPNANLGVLNERISEFTVHPRKSDADLSQPVKFYTVPLLRATSDKLSDVFVLAYDDIKSVQYFHRDIDAYYKTVYGDFDSMLKVAVAEAYELRDTCAKFDADLISKMKKVSPAYAKLGSLAYRQTIAAHKLCEIDGKMMFFSKENFSNGCMATLDVTYPSIPLYLIYNPELVRGMMRPILDYAKSEAWPHPFAPHDCGQYPLCNGQVYGGNKIEYQMPVEECGNAILTVAAATRADGDRTLAEENKEILMSWADYLIEYGYNPENQLCTDDFAGHLAQNCNLSVKAIVALGAFGQLFGEEKYTAIAKEMADRWKKEAKKQNGRGWRVSFDREDTWSLKYNMVWDRLLGLGLFGEDVAREEISVYAEKMNEYGVPLDCRANYTKLDWMAWTTVMADVPEYTQAVYESMTNMTRDSLDRVPMTDWYDTVNARQIGFQARSVLGGLFINLLLEHPNFRV